MNKSFLTIAASLAVTAVFLSSVPTISDAASSTTAVSTTAESRYTASFTVQQPEKKLEKPHEEKKGEKLARGERHGRKPNADKQATVKPVRVEPKAGEEGRSAEKSGEKPHRSNRRRHYRKPKPKTGGENG